ncbi:hypothetical protein VTN77DRAFT_1967 [Rasamsonia byssochlamydoides]|uniref:uncharacterized protein n=1 Tax=Rasamsonia byssochlamydoides TaxID=89139 RepID=UPI00374240A7
MSRISHNPPQNNNSGVFHRGTITEHETLLEYAIRLMDLLDSHPAVSQSATPILWHTDLHMGNIFVSPNEPSQIVSLIDWQLTCISPAFLQAGWPIFLEPPRNYTKGLVKPPRPDNLEKLDAEDRALALYEWRQANCAKAYEVSTFLENRPAHNAMMNAPAVLLRELFTRCSEISETGVLPLRACLIEIFQNWTTLGFPAEEECPYSFTPVEIQEHEAQFSAYQAWHELQELVRECLDTDAEGWIAPEVDIAVKFGLFVERLAGEKSVDEARWMWPFTEFERDE